MAASKSPRAQALLRLRQILAEPFDPKEDIEHTFFGHLVKPGKSDFSDRAAALVATQNLELTLRAAVASRFRPLSPNEERSLFSGEVDAPLSNFAALTNVGYALEIYGPHFRDDLILIKNIRNAFAHARRHLDFRDIRIAEACSQIKYGFGGVWDTPLLPSDIFLRTAQILAIYLYRFISRQDPIKDAALYPRLASSMDS